MTTLRVRLSPSLVGLAVKTATIAAKFVKIGLAITSIGAYALIFTWQFALVITGMLVIHEYGHLKAMHRVGMKTKGIFLIPFLGAAAVSEEDFPTRRDEVYIAIAGPLVGFALAVIAGLLYVLHPWPYFAAVASWMALINLFNLLPVTPLDGGRVVKSLTLSIKSWLGMGTMIAGMCLGAFLAFTQNFWIFVIIIPLSVLDYIGERRSERKKTFGGVYHPKPKMTRSEIIAGSAAYATLVLALFAVMYFMAKEPGAAGAMKVLQG